MTDYRYGNPPIVVTESGCDVPNEATLPLEAALKDTFRLDYYQSYLAAATAAKHKDGVNLQVRPPNELLSRKYMGYRTSILLFRMSCIKY